MAQEIYHRSEWGNPNEQWGNVYLNADLTNELYKRASEYENSWVTDQLLNGVGTKPSIIMTPTAYEDGVLNSVKPPKTFGSELVTNGTFDTDSDWTLGTGWSIANGKASFDENIGGAGNIEQNIGTVIGRTYKLHINTLESNGGNIAYNLGGGFVFINQVLPNNIYTIYVTATSSFIQLRGSSNFIGSIDNVSVKEVIDADFDFTRGSSATRVNEKGLIQDVQILSGELVQNGDFEQIGSEEVSNGDFEQIGSEQVVNGDFSDNSWWGLDLVWSISNGSANCIGSGTIYKGGILTIGKTYKVQVEISSYTSGTLTYPNASYTLPSAVGSYTFYYKANSQTISFTGTSFTGSIDNVSVKEVGQDWEFTDGATITDNGVRIVSDGTLQKITQNNILTVGKQYKIQYEILENNSGELKLSSSFGLTPIPSTVGTHTVYAEALQTFLSILRVSTCDITITNISVKEVGQNWIFNTGWSMGDGVAIGNASIGTGSIYQQGVFEIGKKYQLKLDATLTSGSFKLEGSGGSTLATFNETKSYDVIIEATQVDLMFRRITSSFIGTIDNISVQEVTDDTDLPRINYTNFDYQDVLGDELITNGNFDTDSNWSKSNSTISGGKGNLDGNGQTSMLWQNILTQNKSYKVTFTVSDYNGLGSARIWNNDGYSYYIIAENGTFTVYFNHIISNANLLFVATDGAVYSIDNVSVKEFTEDVLVPYSGEGSLLLEPQSTNTATYSNDFTQGDLFNGSNTPSLGFSVLTQNQGTAPDGTNTAQKLTDINDGNVGGILLSFNSTNLTSGTSTISMFVKKDTVRYFAIGSINFDTDKETSFDLDTGTVNRGEGVMTYYGNGWYRCSATITTTTDLIGSIRFYITENSAATGGTTRNGTNSTFLWGLQAEQLSYATSYIPTEGSIKTRLQDICNNAGSSDLINSTEGVLYAEISALADDGETRIISLSQDGDTTNRINIFQHSGSNRIKFVVKVNNTNIFDEVVTLSNILNYNKIALSYKENEFKVYINGVKEEEQLSGSIYPANTLDKLNFDQGGGNYDFYGNVKCVAVFKEALSDTELQKLTQV